jgi:hypothetical protein
LGLDFGFSLAGKCANVLEQFYKPIVYHVGHIFVFEDIPENDFKGVSIITLIKEALTFRVVVDAPLEEEVKVHFLIFETGKMKNRWVVASA